MENKTAMQELLDHFNDAWSSPSDLWNPSVVIDKVESMLEKEKEQISTAYAKGFEIGSDGAYLRSYERYYNETYKQD